MFDKSVADLIYHEMAHVMTFQDCKTYEQYENEVLILWKQHIYFPNCGYCNKQEDGAEDIAEGFVAMKNNIDIPDKIKDMVESFIKRKKIK